MMIITYLVTQWTTQRLTPTPFTHVMLWRIIYLLGVSIKDSQTFWTQDPFTIFKMIEYPKTFVFVEYLCGVYHIRNLNEKKFNIFLFKDNNKPIIDFH